MKLISVQVYNFGTLSNFKYQFADGLNVISEDNGFGKTTLAVFIKAMFYGLDNGRIKGLDNNERKKYTPWNGGKMGGNLVFSVHNQTYRIERVFGQTMKKDTFSLANAITNQESHDYSSDIGLELFGIDSGSFEKSSYFVQKPIPAEYSESIRNRLTYLLEVTDNTVSFESAKKIIDEKRRRYFLNSNKGEIVSTTKEIQDLKKELAVLRNQEKQVAMIECEYDSITSQMIRNQTLIKEYQASIATSAQVVAKMEIKKQLNRQQDDIILLEKKIASFHKVITTDEINKLKQKINEYDALSLELKNIKNDESYQKIHCYNKNLVADILAHKLGDDEINNLHQAIDDYYQKNSLISVNQENEYTDERYQMLSLEVKNFGELIYQYSSIKKIPVLVGFSSGIALVGLSFIFRTMIAWVFWMMLIFGVIIISGFSVWYLLVSQKKTKSKKQMSIKIEEAINRFEKVSCCNLKSGVSYQETFEEMKYLLMRASDYLLEGKRVAEGNKKTKDELHVTSEKLKKIFTHYEITNCDYRANIASLQYTVKDYLNTKARVDRLQDQYLKTKEHYELVEQEIESLLHTYHIEDPLTYQDALITLIGVTNDLTFASNDLKHKKQKLNDYMKENGINDEYFHFDEVDVNSLNDGLNQQINENNLLLSRRTHLEKEMEEINKKVELINIYEVSILEKEKELEVIKRDYEILGKVTLYLEKAKEQLSSSYIRPMKESFFKYARMLSDDIVDGLIDTNLEIKIDHSTGYKEFEYFSQGYQDLIDMCMRFALVDNLYHDEIPFLILDDPFVNLDDDKLQKAKKLLLLLTEKYQIIHFVCSNTRK